MGWKIYFWFQVILWTFRFSVGWGWAGLIIELILTLPLMAGLYLYAYKKPVLSDRIWKLLFNGSAILIPLLLLISSPPTNLKKLIEFAFSGAFVAPAFIALYCYAYRFLPQSINYRGSSQILWKVYFWFLILTSLASLPFLSKGGFTRIWDVIDLCLVTISMLGFFGYCWRKPIFSSGIWKGFFPLFVIWTIAYHFFIPFPAQFASSGPIEISQEVASAIAIVMVLPQYIALARYAYRNADLWGHCVV